jgi:hypothetical protein
MKERKKIKEEEINRQSYKFELKNNKKPTTTTTTSSVGKRKERMG